MTSPKRSLHPASGNDGGPLLGAFELVSGGGMQLAEIVGAEVGQGMTLEPSPQILHGVQVWRVRRQEGDLDVSSQAVQIVPHQMAAVRLQAIPDHQQGLLQVSLERFEEFDDFLLFDSALVQPKQAVGACEPGYDRDVVPVEVKLDDGGLPLGCPGAHAGGAFADAGLVHKDNQSAFPLGFFN